MMIRKRPHLGWLIRFWFFLMCFFLVASLSLNVIYLNHLKKDLSDVKNKYFSFQKNIYLSLVDLSDMRSEMLKYIQLSHSTQLPPEIQGDRLHLAQNIYSKSIHIVALMDDIQKKQIPLPSDAPLSLSEISRLASSFALSYQSLILSISESKDQKHIEDRMATLDRLYQKIQADLIFFSSFVEEHILEKKESPSFLVQYLPLVFFGAFLLVSVVSAIFIYISRNEIRHSVIENTRNLLNESAFYQDDCLETLRACQEFTKIGLHQLKDIQATSLSSSGEHVPSAQLMSILEKIEAYALKIERSFELRKDLHAKEGKNIDMALKKLTP